MNRKRKILIWSASILCGLILSPPGAQAVLITVQIEAVVDGVHDALNYLEGLVGVGDLINGTYTYDTDTPNTSSIPQVGWYEHYTYPCGFSLSVSGLHFVTDTASPYFIVEIVNDFYGDGYSVLSYHNLPLSNGAIIDKISWGLRDDSGSAISSAELLATAPVLSSWLDFNYLNVEGPGSRDNILFQAHVTSAYVIPEPGTVLLIGIGAIALVRRMKK